MEKTYQRTVLFSSEAFEVVSCEWKNGSISPMHGHQGSQCAVLVQEGVFENTTRCAFKKETATLEAGGVFTTPLGAAHEIRCISEKGKTLHVYSPRISKEEKALSWSTSSEEVQAKIPLSFSSEGASLKEVTELLKKVEELSLPTHSPYFMNQLFSGVFPQTQISQEVLNRTRTTLATSEASPVFSLIEKQVVQELGEQIGWNSTECDGITVAGGSAANFMAMHCARQRMWPQAKQKGLLGARPRLYVSEEAHYSFKKGAAALGFGTDAVVAVGVDATQRMCPQKLEQKIKEDIEQGYQPFFIGATAGTTVYGAFDPFEALSVVAQKYKLWLHADAAWGAPALFTKKAKHLVQGIALVDSLTFDAHKFFGSNLTSSFYITRHPQILFAANDVKGGEYLFHDSGDVDRGRMSWQCGRGAEVLSFWTLWKHLGTNGMTQSIDSMLDIKDQATSWIKEQSRLVLLADPEFLNICVEVIPKNGVRDPQWSKIVREKLISTDQAMVNYSTDASGSTFLRLIIVHPQLRLQHIQNILEAALKF